MKTLMQTALRFLADKVILALFTILLILVLLNSAQALQGFNFMLSALVGVAPYLLLAVALAAAIKASGADQSIANVFSGHPLKAVILASLFGALSPFCSCGVIPLIAALLGAGVPLAPVMAFWIASPIMDPEMFILTAAGIGLDFAIAKAILAVAMGLLAGFIVYIMHGFGWQGEILRHQTMGSGCASSCGADTAVQAPEIQFRFWQDPDRIKLFKDEFLSTIFFLSKWLALAFLLESLMLSYINPDWVKEYIGGDTLWAIPLAAFIGLPSYLNGYAAIPMVNGLMELGMSQAAGMTFMLTGAVSSIPAAIAVFALVRRKIFVAYLLIGLLGSTLFGFLYHFLVL